MLYEDVRGARGKVNTDGSLHDLRFDGDDPPCEESRNHFAKARNSIDRRHTNTATRAPGYTFFTWSRVPRKQLTDLDYKATRLDQSRDSWMDSRSLFFLSFPLYPSVFSSLIFTFFLSFFLSLSLSLFLFLEPAFSGPSFNLTLLSFSYRLFFFSFFTSSL